MNIRLAFFRVLAVLQIVITFFVALAASFADGGQWWDRLVLSLLQPVTAILILVLVMQKAPSMKFVKATTWVLIVQVIASVAISATIFTGVAKGDWFLPLIFAVVPLIILSYCYHLRRG